LSPFAEMIASGRPWRTG